MAQWDEMSWISRNGMSKSHVERYFLPLPAIWFCVIGLDRSPNNASELNWTWVPLNDVSSSDHLSFARPKVQPWCTLISKERKVFYKGNVSAYFQKPYHCEMDDLALCEKFCWFLTSRWLLQPIRKKDSVISAFRVKVRQNLRIWRCNTFFRLLPSF